VSGWADVPAGSGFDVDRLPYGVAELGGRRRVVVRIGTAGLDLAAAAENGLFADVDAAILSGPSLDALLAAGPERWASIRARLRDLVTDRSVRDRLRGHPVDALRLVLPWTVGDYVDFYSSEHHAANVGRMFRPDAEPLLPNWKHLPIGYHGRAGTVVVSGTDVVRPCGQHKPADGEAPMYGPSARLDIEAEVGFIAGAPSTLGERLSTSDLRAHVFGVVLVNDWSARDIQAWEYVPLGPFLAKSFATSVSAWVTPLAALDAARVDGPAQDPPVLDYLSEAEPRGLDLTLEVRWNGTTVARPPYAPMYWSPGQQLAHLTVNGARLRTGDLYASGTVSGPERDQRGSFLELCWAGTEPVTLDDGATRTFLEDGDEVTIGATAPGLGGGRICLGEVTGRVLPARP